MNQDNILRIALPYIKGFEGFRSRPYLDQVGVATIGYGTTYYANGTHVSMSDQPVSEDQASDMLTKKIMTEFMPGLARIFNNSNAINSNQFAALLSFAYNMGVGALAGSTLARLLNAGNVVGASEQFPLWDKAGGVENAGLKARRLKEQALFNTPI